jgi:hypothetical protein
MRGRSLLNDVLARRVPVSLVWRYRVSLQRKKCRQQIIGLNDESFSIAVRIDAKEEFRCEPQSSFAAIRRAGALSSTRSLTFHTVAVSASICFCCCASGRLLSRNLLLLLRDSRLELGDGALLLYELGLLFRDLAVFF